MPWVYSVVAVIGVFHSHDSKVHAGSLLRQLRDGVRPGDRNIKLPALRRMAQKACGVGIRSCGVILAGVSVDIVVARRTAAIRRDWFVGESLSMALHTVANILGEPDRGKILYTLIATDNEI